MYRANRKVPVNPHLYLGSKIGGFYIRNHILYRLAQFLVNFLSAGELLYILLIRPDVVWRDYIDFFQRNLQTEKITDNALQNILILDCPK
jgi:hypothetical protein